MAHSPTVTLIADGMISAIRSDPAHALHGQIDSRRFQTVEPGRSVDDHLCQLLGLGEPFPAAALTSPVDLVEPGHNIRFRADPVYMDATAGGLTLSRINPSELDVDESNEFVDYLNGVLEPDDLTLRTGTHPGRWYLQAEQHFDVICSSPYVAQVEGVDAATPQGPQSRDLMALMSSVQIELHDFKLNEGRIDRGQAPINGIWIWGHGQATAADSVAFDTMLGEHPFLEAVGAAGLAHAGTGLNELAGEAVVVVERDQTGFAALQTLLDMIEAGEVSCMHLLDPAEGALEIRRSSWITRLIARTRG